MPVKINTPNGAWSDTTPTLGGNTYTIEYRYNERDEDDPHWRIDIYLADGTLLIGGIRLVPNLPLLSEYVLDDFRHGDLICVRMLKTDRQPVRDNVGKGKEYTLCYFTGTELYNLSIE